MFYISNILILFYSLYPYSFLLILTITINSLFESLSHFYILCLVGVYFYCSRLQHTSSENTVISLFHQLIRLCHFRDLLPYFLLRWNILPIFVPSFPNLRTFSYFSLPTLSFSLLFLFSFLLYFLCCFLLFLF